MIPKKNKGADLEGKRGVFFLFGIALSLTAAIYVMQIERGFAEPELPKTQKYTFADDATPRTVQTVEEVEKKLIRKEKINLDMPPEIVPDDDPKLKINDLFKNPTEPTEEGLTIIDGPNDVDDAVPIEFVMIENIARPYECEGISNKDEQKECFNKWIQGYIAQNTKYPTLAKEIGLEGKVYVNFVISETGAVEQVSLVQGEYELLNEEALRVVSAMPEMIPGRQAGRNAKMTLTIPVNFKLGNR